MIAGKVIGSDQSRCAVQSPANSKPIIIPSELTIDHPGYRELHPPQAPRSGFVEGDGLRRSRDDEATGADARPADV